MTTNRRGLFALLAIVGLASPALAQTTSPGREAVEAFYLKVINAPDDGARQAAAEQAIAVNWKSIGDFSGKAKTRGEFVAQISGIRKGVPDLKWEIVEIVQSGDRFTVIGRGKGTPVAPMFGVPPSGRSFDVLAIDVHKVAGGRIVESYHVEDWAGAVRQLSTK